VFDVGFDFVGAVLGADVVQREVAVNNGMVVAAGGRVDVLWRQRRSERQKWREK